MRRAHKTGPWKHPKDWKWNRIGATLLVAGCATWLGLMAGPRTNSTTSPPASTHRTASMPSVVVAGSVPSTTLPTKPAPPTTVTTEPAPATVPPSPEIQTPAPASEVAGSCGPPYDPNDGTGVTCAQFVAWTRVADCEESGWGTYAEGPRYYGSLGESSALWDTFPQFDRTQASADQQIVVGLSVVGAATPDQGTVCASW